MRIFQSSITTALLQELQKRRPDIKVNVLRSYELDKEETENLLFSGLNNIGLFILDSGVWSKHTGKAKRDFTVKSYADFLSRNKDFFHLYFNFDEAFFDEGQEEFDNKAFPTNLRNQLFLEDKGLKPVPVLHSYEDHELNYYLNRKDDYDYIAIGSGLARKEQIKGIYTSEVVNTFYENGFKVHLFAVGSYYQLKGSYAWSSDCSSFARWVACGRVKFYSKLLNEDIEFSFLPTDKEGNPNADYVYGHDKEKYQPILEEYEGWLIKNLSLRVNDLNTYEFYRMLANVVYFHEIEEKVTKLQMANPHIDFDFW